MARSQGSYQQTKKHYDRGKEAVNFHQGALPRIAS